MAEIVRIAEPEGPAGTPSLPQNIEAEAALLGALMIDNRLVEDVQLKLRPHHFFEPLHGRIYEAILRMTDANRVANPVTLRPLFDGDEGMKEVGGPAYLAQLTGSGAAVIGARDFAAADLRPRLAARADRGRARAGRGCARHQRGGRPARPDREGRDRALQGRRGGRRRGQGQVVRRGDQARRSKWPSARSTAAAICPASPPGSTASTARSAECTRPT